MLASKWVPLGVTFRTFCKFGLKKGVLKFRLEKRCSFESNMEGPPAAAGGAPASDAAAAAEGGNGGSGGAGKQPLSSEQISSVLVASPRVHRMADDAPLLLIRQLPKIGFDHLKIHKFLGLSLLLIIKIFLNQG